MRLARRIDRRYVSRQPPLCCRKSKPWHPIGSPRSTREETDETQKEERCRRPAATAALEHEKRSSRQVRSLDRRARWGVGFFGGGFLHAASPGCRLILMSARVDEAGCGVVAGGHPARQRSR